MDASAVEAALRRWFEEHAQDFVAAYLYGSVARGTAGPRSDVDVAVLRAGPAPSAAWGATPSALEDELRHAVSPAIEVVDLAQVPVDLVHRVLRDGRLLLDRDRAARVRFEVTARNVYWDLLPYLRLYRRDPRTA